MIQDVTIRPVLARARGFSLLEMMMAIVILGVGMLMAATMFPIAWQRSRDMAEFTHVGSMANIAEATVNLIGKVYDGTDASSFWGDVWQDNTGQTYFELSPRVHVLEMENAAVEPRNTNGPAFKILYPTSTIDEADDSRVREGMIQSLTPPPPIGGLDPWKLAPPFPPLPDMAPQIRLHDRVYPPLPPPPSYGPGVSSSDHKEWRRLLDNPRFCWSVLHRLIPRPDPSRLPPAFLTPNPTEPRNFDVYVVTLRRPNPLARYARQDPMTIPDNPAGPSEANFLPAPSGGNPGDDDVRFPIPWRVRLWFPSGPAGVPAECWTVMANRSSPLPPTDQNDPLVAQMLTPGSVFVDEDNGLVLRVAQRIFSDVSGNQQSAFFVMDRPVTSSDLDMDGDPDGDGDVAELPERLRFGWVFPPPVDRSDPDNPAFTDKSPVVSVDVRRMTFYP